MPISNLGFEGLRWPAAACARQPEYGGGIAQVPSPCPPSCGIAGIVQDAGAYSVFLHNGEFYLRETDLEIPGRGFNWKFERKYRNGIAYDGPLGHNWEFNHNRRLIVESDGGVLRMDGYSRADRYPFNAGAYPAPSGSYTRLARNTDGGYVERDRNGGKVFYAPPNEQGVARMVEIRDPNGNRMLFEYDAQGRLFRVLDTLSRPILYRYNSQGKLAEVEDFLGRRTRFGYDTNGDLVSVTSPVVTGTPNGNDFPLGKVTLYSYSTGFPDPRLNHNLRTITAPNEMANPVVAGSPGPRVVVTYENNPASPHVDRVLTQTIGGTNRSTVPAGGVIRYEYRALASPRPGDFLTAVFQTTATDRNGNVTEYQFNQLGQTVQRKEFANRRIRAGDAEFFLTRYEYNKDGEMLGLVRPEGNSVEYAYDEGNADRYQQGNLLAETRRPDPRRGGDQGLLRKTYTYEPVFNRLRSLTDERGHAAGYTPQNGGAASAARYTTTNVFDYQEGSNLEALSRELGISPPAVQELLRQAGIAMGLGDINRDGRTDLAGGNIIQVIDPAVTLAGDSNMARIEGGTRQPIEWRYTYNRAGQLTAARDPEGNLTAYSYFPENDPDGDGRDLTPGVGTDPLGYLSATLLDAASSPERNSRTNPPPSQIRQRNFYDRAGNVIRRIDGRGIATQYVVNQLNQVVRIVRAADVSEARRNPEEPNWEACRELDLAECNRGMTAFAYRVSLYYDHNNNVIRREIENRDSNNSALTGMVITREDVYDILDNRIATRRKVSEAPAEVLTTHFRYDANQNRVLVLSPAAVSGEQSSNVVSSVFDERDLLFTSTRGGVTPQFRALGAHAGVPERDRITASPGISTSSRRYDGNRNLTGLTDAADNNGDGRPETTTRLYDGFDRLVSVVDPAGNQSFRNYDPASRLVRESRFGPLGGPTPAGTQAATLGQPLTVERFRQPLLSQTEHNYDELHREFERSRRLFAYAGVSYARTPVLRDGPLGKSGDGVTTTRFEYDRNNRRTFHIEDDLSLRRTFHDGAGRAVRVLDPENNEILYTFDDNSNLVSQTEIERTQRVDIEAGKVPELRETYRTFHIYDSLDRPIRTTDNLGQTRRYHYDARNNRIRATDAQHSKDPADRFIDPLGRSPDRINRPGNSSEYFYDGVNRRISEVRQLRAGGQANQPIDDANPANPDGLIVTDYAWDANSRLVARADDGSLSGDQNTSIGRIEATSSLGNVTRYQYDDLNRLTREISSDGAMQAMVYDADHNLITRVDGNGSVALASYDGLHRLVAREIGPATSSSTHPAGGVKDTAVVWTVIGTTRQQYEYDGLSRPTQATDNNDPDDPEDDSLVVLRYDSMSRLLEEVQNGQAVSSRWSGDDNRIGIAYPNGREIEIAFDLLDRIDRIAGPEMIADYDYIGPKRVLERAYANRIRLSFLDDERLNAVGYDALKRQTWRRHLRPDNFPVAQFIYEYDRENNRVLEIRQQETGDEREDYRYDSAYRLVGSRREGEPEDSFQLDGVGNWAMRREVPNQPNDVNEYSIFAGLPQLHDDNGNLVDDGRRIYQYDSANRLRRVIRKQDEATIASYRYDAFGRRTERIVTEAAGTPDRVRYFHDGWREIEERRDGFTQQYVYGPGLDEPLTLDRDNDGDGILDETFFYHQDGRSHVVSLTTTDGLVAEQISYDVYGRPSVVRSAVGNPYLFAGRRFDPETGFYYYRMRYYDPSKGRFLQRDPLGMWADGVAFGNGYLYAASNPVNRLDPMGLWCEDPSPVERETCTGSTDIESACFNEVSELNGNRPCRINRGRCFADHEVTCQFLGRECAYKFDGEWYKGQIMKVTGTKYCRGLRLPHPGSGCPEPGEDQACPGGSSPPGDDCPGSGGDCPGSGGDGPGSDPPCGGDDCPGCPQSGGGCDPSGEPDCGSCDDDWRCPGDQPEPIVPVLPLPGGGCNMDRLPIPFLPWIVLSLPPLRRRWKLFFKAGASSRPM